MGRNSPWRSSPHRLDAWIELERGINFSAKFVLEFAIMLLGASVSITMIAALGSLVILGIACIVALTLGTSYFNLPLPRPTATHVHSHRLR